MSRLLLVAAAVLFAIALIAALTGPILDADASTWAIAGFLAQALAPLAGRGR